MSNIVGEVKQTPATGYLGIHSITLRVLCTKCSLDIPSVRVLRTHFSDDHEKKYHPGIRVSRDMAKNYYEAAISFSRSLPLSALKIVYENAPYGNAESKSGNCGILNPLHSVKIFSGYQCSICPKCFRSESTMKTHLMEEHNSSLQASESIFQTILQRGTISLQSLRSGNASRPFPVARPTSSLQQASNVPFIVGKKPIDGESGCTPVSEGMPTTVVSEVLNKTPQICPNVPSNTPSRGPSSSNTESVKSLFQSVMNPEYTCEEDNRRTMNSFISLGNWDTLLSTYGLDMKMAHDFNGVIIDESSPTEKLAVEDTKDYLQQVKSTVACMHPSIVSQINMKGAYEFQIVRDSTVEKYAAWAARLVISACRFHQQQSNLISSELHSLVSEYLVARGSGSQIERFSSFHALVKHILLYLAPTSSNIDFMFVRLFLTVSFVKGSRDTSGRTRYQFVEGQDVTHLLASLQYICSCCCIHEIKRNCNTTIEEQITIKFIDVNSPTAASFIKSTLKSAMRSYLGEDGSTEFQDCLQHQSDVCGIVRGVHLSLTQYGEVVKSLQGKVEKLFKDELLFGGFLPQDHLSKIASISDNLRERAVGYSFLSDRKQQDWVVGNTLWLFSRLQTNPTAISRMFVGPATTGTSTDHINVNNTVMLRRGVEDWLNMCQDVQRALLVCLHLSSGLPARGTEIETFNVQNTSFNSRNIYVSERDLLLVARYGKTRATKRYDKCVIRFPDRKTTELVLTYLTLFKGLECLFVEALDGKSAFCSHWQSLFVHRGKRMTDKDIRRVISTTLNQHGYALQFNDIRHLATGLSRRVAQRASLSEEVDLETVLNNIGHNQAGHSVSTAENRYALKTTDIPRISSEEISKYRTWCYHWHKSIKLTPCQCLLRNMNKTGEQSKDMSSINVELLVKQCTQKISNQIESILENKLKRTKSHTSLEQPRKRIVSNIDTRQVIIESANSSCGSINLQQYRQALQQFTKNNKSDFRNHLQLSVTDAVFKKKNNLLIILPTGFGKSYCFLLPIFMEGMRFCSILVVPLVSLVEHLIEVSKNFGIVVGRWNDRHNVDQFQLLVVSAEHIELEEFRSLCSKLKTRNRLARMIFDEAHVYLNWKDFRIVLREVRGTMETLELNIPIILLTATCPPQFRRELVSKFSVQHALLFTSSTIRKNLSYRVATVQNIRMGGKFIPVKEAMFLTLKRMVLSRIGTMTKNEESGRILVFCMTRTDVEDVKKVLCVELQSDQVFGYHSGMEKEARIQVQKDWMVPVSNNSNNLKVMCCTSAFGTGIDTSDVRTVFHIGGSYSILDYIQESGRAGRDGKDADCVVLHHEQYSEKTKRNISLFESSRTLDEQELSEKLEKYEEFITYLKSNQCRKDFLFGYADGQYPGFCDLDEMSNNCDYCIQLQENQCSENQCQMENASVSREDDMAELIEESVELFSRNNDVTMEELGREDYSNNKITLPAASILDQFRAFAEQLHPYCIPCIVLEGKQMTHRSCRQRNMRCMRCFGVDHQVSMCSYRNRLENHCSRCFLRKCEGKNVHTIGLGKDCVFEQCRDLCWMLWNSGERWRAAIGSELFRGRFSEQYYAFKLGNNEGKLRQLFDDWIKTLSIGSVPNIITLCLWWNRKTSFNNV